MPPGAPLALVFALTLPSDATGEEKKQPVGTVTVTVYRVGVGVGIGAGSGTFELGGKQYLFSVSSFSVGDLGVAEVTARGNVYDLSDVSDFPGTYRGFEGSAELGVGGGAATLKNAKGVVVELVAEAKGVRLDVGPVGIRIRMNVDPRPLQMRN